jgi:hypothetical protein
MLTQDDFKREHDTLAIVRQRARHLGICDLVRRLRRGHGPDKVWIARTRRVTEHGLDDARGGARARALQGDDVLDEAVKVLATHKVRRHAIGLGLCHTLRALRVVHNRVLRLPLHVLHDAAQAHGLTQALRQLAHELVSHVTGIPGDHRLGGGHDEDVHVAVGVARQKVRRAQERRQGRAANDGGVAFGNSGCSTDGMEDGHDLALREDGRTTGRHGVCLDGVPHGPRQPDRHRCRHGGVFLEDGPHGEI